MLTLYQFPISHFCEKVRWTLKFKDIDHKVRNLLPGLHALKTRKLAAQTSVPIVVDEGTVIQGSDNIITYLDDKFPEKSLTPESSQLKEESLEWEKYVDKEIGIHVRRCCYHILLQHPDIVISFFSQDGPWYGKFVLKRMFPRLKSRMRDGMKISEESARDSRERLGLAIDRLHEHLQEHEFLVGNEFTRADLSAASLLAPLCMPEKYGLIWPEKIPDKLQELTAEFEQRIAWVDKVYENFR